MTSDNNIKEMVEYYNSLVKFESVCQEIGRSEKDVQDEFQQLNKWLNQQRHLPQNAMDEVSLQKFLIGMKGNAERARARLDSYFAIRNIVPYLFNDRDPLTEGMLTANSFLYLSILPGLTEDRARVVMVGLTQQDPDLMNLDNILKRIFNLLDTWMRTDPFATRVYIVTDTALATMSHILKVSPARIREATYCLQNVYPVRIQGLIFLNVKPFMKTAIDKLIKPLFRKKLGKRVHVFTNDLSEFYKKIPLSMLPRDYEGESPSFENLNKTWIEHVNKNREWLMTAGTITSDESKREGKCPVSGPSCVVM